MVTKNLENLNVDKNDGGLISSETNYVRRSGSACGTCRIRRVKCDKAKPTCTRCLSTGRKCDGYSRPTSAKAQPAPVAMLVVTLSNHPDLSQASRYSLDYFRIRSVPAFSNYGTQQFWSGVVLAAAEAEHGIRDLIIAASHLDQATSSVADRNTNKLNTTYLTHYGRGLKALTPTRDTRVMLIACIILILCADYEQDAYAAIKHIQAGRRILEELGTIPRNDILFDIRSIFYLLWQHSPELSARDASIFHPNISPTRALRESPPPCTDRLVTWAFASVDEAADALRALVPGCLKQRQTSKPPSTRFHVIPEITESLNHWLQTFNQLVQTLDHSENFVDHVKSHILRAYHLILAISSRCVGFGDETLYDNYINDLDGLVKKMHLFSRLVNVNSLRPAVFWIMCKTRDVANRRSLMSILRHTSCGPEGTFLAEVVDAVIVAEEYGIGQPVACCDIPRKSRLSIQGIVKGTNPNTDLLLCHRDSDAEQTASCIIPLQIKSDTVRATEKDWRVQVLADALNMQFEL